MNKIADLLKNKRRDCLFTTMASLSATEAKYIRHDEQFLRSAVQRKLFENMVWGVIDKYYDAIEHVFANASLDDGREDFRLELVIFPRSEWIEICQRINRLEHENERLKGEKLYGHD